MTIRPCAVRLAILFAAAGLLAAPAPRADSRDAPPADIPRAHDPRLRVELFAAAPDIVHPVSLDFDSRGRLLVIESHTHFRPKDYQGPPHDRVRVLEDTDGDGKADRFTTFFEGTRFTMDVAAHPDGSVYLATRNEILRLRDTDGDGTADERQRIVFLDTAGDYPHNGLSGLAFDSKGDLYFGLGENIGADYKLIGADGTTIVGGGEGGNVFWCTADGKKLRRVATGFWNPFGLCRDIFGRLVAVDNDPDAMPPCRMVHVVEGGDYGYQFRYGRSGRHLFQSWHGQLPGTLPMMSGTGEAPCEVVSYESDGLPREYVGNLLVTSWADHRVERYAVKEHGASLTAEWLPFVQGGADFRPVGLAVAPDGSLFVSDWVLRDYNLHGRGAVWHIRPAAAAKPDRPTDPRRALFSAHRPLREAAAKQLAADEAGREFLRNQLGRADVRARAASLTALLDHDDRAIDLNALAEKDALTPIRATAVHALVARGDETARFLDAKHPPAVRLEAIASLRTRAVIPRLLQYLVDPDPFLRHAAVQQLARCPDLLAAIDLRTLPDPRQRTGLLLAHRASGRPESVRLWPAFFADADEDVRFLAAKWAADEKLDPFRPLLAEALRDRQLNVRLYTAYATALGRIDGQDVSEAKMADHFLEVASDDQRPPAQRARALQFVPAKHKKLTPEVLNGLLAQDDPALQSEAVRALCEHPSPKRFAVLRDVARDPHRDDAVRAEAVLGLSERAQDSADDLLALARGGNAALRDEALRGLVDVRLTPDQRREVQQLAERHPPAAALAARVLGQPFWERRPPAGDTDAWLKRLDGPADPAAGRRIFFHPRLAGCFRCHKAEGRGADVGPDLSDVGRAERRNVLDSILRPSNAVAPHYQTWRIDTADGKAYTGLLIRTYLDEYTYVDTKGEPFTLNTRQIVETRPVPASLMPDGLPDLLTDRELRDLLAYLCSHR
jgi:putative membrane-bound dehydrogenase-like protein